MSLQYIPKPTKEALIDPQAVYRHALGETISILTLPSIGCLSFEWKTQVWSCTVKKKGNLYSCILETPQFQIFPIRTLLRKSYNVWYMQPMPFRAWKQNKMLLMNTCQRGQSQESVWALDGRCCPDSKSQLLTPEEVFLGSYLSKRQILKSFRIGINDCLINKGRSAFCQSFTEW